MANFGLNDTGFTLKRFSDITANIYAALRTDLGNVTSSTMSVVGIIVSIVGNALADIWESMQADYFQMFARTATGASLDYAVQRVGINRLQATNSAGPLNVTASIIPSLPTIPSGFQASANITGTLFQTTASYLMTVGECCGAMFSVDSAGSGRAYTLTIGGTLSVTYSASGTDTIITIAAGLATAFVAASSDQTLIANGDGTLSFTCSYKLPQSITCGAYMTIQEVTNTVEVTALNAGALPAPYGSLVNIATPVSQILSVFNPEDAATGSATETDDALRARYFKSFYLPGKCTLNGMFAYLMQNIPNIASAFIHENDPLETDPVISNPVGTIAIFVDSAEDNNTIAKAIFACKPAGIATWAEIGGAGTEYGIATDNMGVTRKIWFATKQTKYLWLKVTCTKYLEETLALNWQQQIYQAMQAVAATQSLGKDIVLQRYAAPVMSIPGIGECFVEAVVENDSTTVPGPSDYSSSNLPVSANIVVQFANPEDCSPNVSITIS